MLRYAAGRLAGMLFVIIAVSMLVHLLIHIVPGDPVDSIAGQNVSPETREAVRKSLGLDLPLHRQYWRFLSGAVRMDFGVSFITRKPIGEAIIERFPKTLYLASSAILIAVLAGIAAGIITALNPRTIVDKTVMLLAVVGVSAPVFVTALLLRYFLADKWGIFPTAGYGGLEYVALPALTLGSRSAAYLARVTRTTLLEILSEDYIRTALAKGLSRPAALLRHALPNAAAPLLSVILLDFAMYLNGSVITETIFTWQGLGVFAYSAIMQRDLPAIQAIVLVMAVTYVIAIALADILRAVIDPRLRAS